MLAGLTRSRRSQLREGLHFVAYLAFSPVQRGGGFTIAYRPQAHAKSFKEVKEALVAIFGRS